MRRYRLTIRLVHALLAVCLGLACHIITWAQTDALPLPTAASEPAATETPLAVFDEIW